MNSNIENQIKKALQSLGVKGEVKIKNIDTNRYLVLIQDKEFGVYDSIKQTFVD